VPSPESARSEAGRRGRRFTVREGGQAAVEVVGMLPLLALAGLAVLQLLVAGAAHEYAGHAAEAGAIALADGRDVGAAARAAIPGWSGRRLAVRVDGRRVEVHLRPPAILRSIGDLLAAEVTADAGPRE
jgi:pilus assembly protein CpaE